MATPVVMPTPEGFFASLLLLAVSVGIVVRSVAREDREDDALIQSYGYSHDFGAHR